MRRWAFGLGLTAIVAVACATRGSGPRGEAEARGPLWTRHSVFVATSTSPDRVRIAGVGVETIADPCSSSALLVAAAKNRALAELAKFFDVAPGSEAAIATLRGATVTSGWFDGSSKIYALAMIERPAADAAKLASLDPSGGVALAHVEDQIKDAARARAAECSCGDGPACRQDYKCEDRQGAKRCICRGSNCPCEVRGCKPGETCGDGRCY